MRLLKTDTFELVEFVGEEVPKYAILSHTWEGKEVSFRDIQHPDALTYLKADEPPTPAWMKVKQACRKAQDNKFEFIWIDTCCIDKSSSAELQEAINSMFAWYRKSAICYAFLSDIQRPSGYPPSFDITCSRWFTRGWTLQELLAPDFLQFYDISWKTLGSRNNWAEKIWKATAIPVDFLFSPAYDAYYGFVEIPKVRESIEDKLRQATVAAKMSWAANRQTTRVEDQAYCLLGLFDINIPMLYGEGKKAFMRLQQEIIKTSDDATILAWGYGMPLDRDAYMAIGPEYDLRNPQMDRQRLREQACKIRPRSLLATSPVDFRFAGALKRYHGPRDLSLHFGISQRGLMLDGLFGFDARSSLQYLFLPCVDPNDNILALPMLSLFDIDRSQPHRDRSLASAFCVPISMGPNGNSPNAYGVLAYKRSKYYLCGSFNVLTLPPVYDKFFDSRTWELSFRKQPPWPKHKDSDFSLETVYPALSRQPFRFVADKTGHRGSITQLYSDLISSEGEVESSIMSRGLSSDARVFILNITGKKILLVLDLRSDKFAVCHAAILTAEELLRPTWAELASILQYPSSKAPRIPCLKPRSPTAPPYLIFKLFPGLELWAKWM